MRRDRDQMRRDSLEAGLAMVKETWEIDRLVALERVARRLGVAPETVRRVWRPEPRRSYLWALTRYVCQLERFRSVAVLPEMIRKLADSPDLLEDVKKLLQEDFKVVRDDEGFAVQLLLMGGRPKPSLRTALTSLYVEFDKALVEPLDYLFERLGRTVVDPFGTRHLAVLLNALVEGMTMRARVDPDHAEYKVYEAAVLCILVTWTCPIDAPVSMQERVADLATWTKRPPEAA
jgi:hypothetical protein